MKKSRTKEESEAWLLKAVGFEPTKPKPAPPEADFTEEDEDDTFHEDLTFEQMSVEQLDAILLWNEGEVQMTLAFLSEFRPYVEARRRGEPVRWQE